MSIWPDPARIRATCTCAQGVLCAECAADLALLANHPDPLAQIAASIHTPAPAPVKAVS